MTRTGRTKQGLASSRGVYRLWGVVIVSLALSSCCLFRAQQQRPLPVAQKAEEIANVYVTAYPEVPWASISSVLAPNRNWKITDAQAVADNTTAAQTSLISSLLTAALGVSLPTSTSSISTNKSGGTEQTTESQTHTSGTPPATPVTGTAPALPSAPSLGSSGAVVPVDGADLLVASTALFQQAILDNQISQQYLPLGYSAHLLTFQVNIQPLRRDWPYDVYVDLTLVPDPLDDTRPWQSYNPGSKEGRVFPPVVIKPLIISDAVETASVQNSIEMARQALLQLSGTIGTVGASGGFGTSSSSQSSIASYAKNSLVTAGRISDSTIRIRLGAETSGASAPVLVPRTYNVSVFVLTRIREDEVGHDHSLEAISGVSFARVIGEEGETTGRSESQPTAERPPLLISASRKRRDLADQVREKLTLYDYSVLAKDCASGTSIRVAPPTPPSPTDVDTYLDILRAVDQGDYGLLTDCVGKPLTYSQEERLHRLVADLEKIQSAAPSSQMIIPLRASAPLLPDAGVLSYLTENSGGQEDTITLPGGRNLRTDHLRARAYVTLSGGGASKAITPSAISFSGDPNPALVLTVPSANVLTVAGAAAVGDKAKGKAAKGAADSVSINSYSAVELIINDDDFQGCSGAITGLTHACYTNIALVKQPRPVR